MIRSPSLCVKRFSLKKLNRDAAADRTFCRDAYRTARAQNARPCSFWSLGALLDQWLRPAIFALESSYKETALARFQFAHSPDKPLDGLPEDERNAALVKIAEQI